MSAELEPKGMKPMLCIRGVLGRSRRARRLKDPPQMAPSAAGATSAAFPARIASTISAFVILLISLTCLTSSPALAAVASGKHPLAPSHKKLVPTALSEFGLGCPLKFITGICTDGPHYIWVSGEDHGLYAGKITYRHLRGRTRASGTTRHGAAILSQRDFRIHWYHFDRSNSPGLASNFITAICVDGDGRLWAGTDRRGVCVYNGRHWKHYSILNGPLGCHVYAIAYDRYAAQVWIATENGISIYQCGHNPGAVPVAGASASTAANSAARYSPHTWHYITSINHLPPNPDCMAFNSRGMAFVGTLCSGLAIGRPIMKASGPPGAMFAHRKLTYRWRIVTGPWHMPLTATGHGLPSNLINCILVGARHGRIYVGTDLGLAISSNHGQSFHYIRGSDYAAKVMGLWHPPVGYHPPPQAFLNKLLPGDHITTIAQDAGGDIWVGTWRNGYAVLNTRTGRMIKSEDEPELSKQDGYINRLCPLVLGPQENGRRQNARRRGENVVATMLIGRYDFGVHCFAGRLDGPMPKSALAEINPTRFALPAFAKPPNLAELDRYRRQLNLGTKQAANIHFPWAAPLRMDWATQGDWAGRYGWEYAILCATEKGLSFTYGDADHPARARAYCGPHHRWPFECLREWLTKRDTDNPRSLYQPQRGYRQQANWDDHGETYPTTFQGPDIWVRVHLKVPGLYRLSLYLFNKDAHAALYNRQRDWLAEVYPVPPGEGKYLILPPLTASAFPTNPMAQHYARWAMASAPMAVERAADVWNPVYLRFALAGPGRYMVRLVRGSSLNTEICGVFIDRLDVSKKFADDFYPHQDIDFGSVCYQAPPLPAKLGRGAQAVLAAWRAARHSFGSRGTDFRTPTELECYRYAAASGLPAPLLARMRWRLDIWIRHDRLVFDSEMDKAFWSWINYSKQLRAIMAKYGQLQPNSGELGKHREEGYVW